MPHVRTLTDGKAVHLKYGHGLLDQIHYVLVAGSAYQLFLHDPLHNYVVYGSLAVRRLVSDPSRMRTEQV